jgi:hypothetical protein
MRMAANVNNNGRTVVMMIPRMSGRRPVGAFRTYNQARRRISAAGTATLAAMGVGSTYMLMWDVTLW